MIFAITKFPRVAPNGMHIRIKVGSDVGVCTTWNETSLIHRPLIIFWIHPRIRAGSWVAKLSYKTIGATIFWNQIWFKYIITPSVARPQKQGINWTKKNGDPCLKAKSYPITDAAFWTATWRNWRSTAARAFEIQPCHQIEGLKEQTECL